MKSNNGIIRIGIDLGTTNSLIAINNGLNTEVISNLKGDLYTPSIFGISKGGNKIIGKDGYNDLFVNATNDSIKNYKAEIKRLMGTSEKTKFPRNNTEYLPEEISSEILKSLKADALRRAHDLQTVSAVITIPASFDTVQAEATKRAGQLAGFDHIVLIQEPIAAAIAYGFNNSKDENWLVYDLGGGTFDCALISSKEGTLRVINHSGDNYLGGKDIDKLIIDEVFIPQIIKNKKYKFTNFSEKNDKYKTTFSRLKSMAEDAKIKLSSLEFVEIDFSVLRLKDDEGLDVDVFFNFKKTDFEKLIDHLVEKTIKISKDVIKESGIKIESISKIVFVGATTQIPYLRYKIENSFDYLIPVDTSENPFTVVAKGAAIFGLSQKVPTEILHKDREIKNEEVIITLNYDAMTAEEETLITGTLNLTNPGDHFIVISADNGFYNSDMLKINNNTFYINIPLELNKTNNFWIYLIDDKGNHLDIFPNSFSITQGLTVMGAPIPHTIGIIYAQQKDNLKWVDTCEPFFQKNSVPPLKDTKTFRTIKELVKGTEEILPIIVYEGDSENPTLNEEITRIGIDGTKLPFNLAKNEEVEITISINEARELDVEVYIPIADIELNARVDIYSKDVSDDHLVKSLKEAKKEFKDISSYISEEEKETLERDLKQIEASVQSSDDLDTKQKAVRDIKVLQGSFSKFKESTSFNRTLERYNDELTNTENIIDEVMDSDVKKDINLALSKIKSDVSVAIENNDESKLEENIKELEILKHKAQVESPTFWITMFMYILTNKHILTDMKQADYHINKTEEAIKNNDFEGIKMHVSQLMNLVSREEAQYMPVNIAGITK